MYTEIVGIDEKGKWIQGRSGMMDRAGNKLTEAMYDSYILCHRTSYTNVERDGKWNTLTSNGELLYDIWFDKMTVSESTNDAYSSVRCIIGDIAYTYTYRDRVVYSERKAIDERNWEQQAVYDERGNRIAIEGGYIEYAIHPETELIVYETKDMAGVRDKDGNELIPTNYGSVYIEYIDGEFFITAITGSGNRRWAIYDIKGNELIPPLYDLGAILTNEKYRMARDDNKKAGLIYIDGTVIIEPRWHWIDGWKDGEIPGCEYIAYEWQEDGTKKNYAMDENGNIIQELPYVYEWEASSDNGEYFLYYGHAYDEDGSKYAKEWVMKNQREEIVYRLSDERLCGLLSYRGISDSEVTDSGTWVFHNHGEDKVVGLVTRAGEIITNESWLAIYEFAFGKAFVRLKDYSYAVIDERGNTLFVPQFTTPIGEDYYPFSYLNYKLYGDTVAAEYHGEYVNEEGLCIR